MLGLFGNRSFDRVLEVGYGSGVFLPELARRCRDLYGIDVHDGPQSVAAALAKVDVRASLFSASAETMPFGDAFFDAVVAVSSFEFISDFDRASVEIARVMKPDGAFFVITPGDSPLLDLGLKILTGADAERDYQGRRKDVLPALRRHFRVVDERKGPSSLFCVYRGLELRIGSMPCAGP